MVLSFRLEKGLLTLLIALFCIFGILLLHPVAFVRRMEEGLLSLRLRMIPKGHPSSRILLVDIDDATVKTYPWPWKPSTYAALLQALHLYRAEAVLFDVALPEASVEEEAPLIEEIRSFGRAYIPVEMKLISAKNPTTGMRGVSSQVLSLVQMHSLGVARPRALRWPHPQNMIAPTAALVSAGKGVGFVFLAEAGEPTSALATPLLVDLRDVAFPSLELKYLSDSLAVTPDEVNFRPDGSILFVGALKEHAKEKNLLVPLNREGKLLVNFSAPVARRLSAKDLLEASTGKRDSLGWQEEVAGKVCVLSTSAFGAGETINTVRGKKPLGEYRAMVLSTLLYRSFLRTLSPSASLVVLALLLAGAGWFSLTLAPGELLSRLVLLALGYEILLFALFGLFRWVLPAIVPPASLFATAGVLLGYRRFARGRREEAIRRTFSPYLPRQMVERAVEGRGMPTLAGARREVTVLAMDLADFARACDNQNPAELVEELRLLFTRARDIVFSREGWVSRFAGDSMVAIFAEPYEGKVHASLAASAAVAVRRMIHELNEDSKTMGRWPRTLRQALATGTVVLGDFGPPGAMDYSALGSVVTSAVEMKAYASPGEILLSEATAEAVKDEYELADMGNREIPSIHEKLHLYLLVGEKKLQGEC